MEIKKDSWLIRIAFLLKKKEMIPAYVTVDQLIWRIPVMFMMVIAANIVAFLGFFFGFFVAKRPALFKNDDKTCSSPLFCSYGYWPTVLNMRIYPIVVVFLCVIAWIIYKFVVWVSLGGYSVVYETTISKTISVLEYLPFFVIVFALILLYFFFKSTYWATVKSILKKWKRNVFHVIEIVD